MNYFCKLLLLLLAGHALADYPLNGDFLSKGKNRHSSPYLAWMPWYWCMACHCLIHAGFVCFLTNSVACGMGEFTIHFATDYAKGEKWISVDQDQFIHLGCKLLWALVIWSVIP